MNTGGTTDGYFSFILEGVAIEHITMWLLDRTVFDPPPAYTNEAGVLMQVGRALPQGRDSVWLRESPAGVDVPLEDAAPVITFLFTELNTPDRWRVWAHCRRPALRAYFTRLLHAIESDWQVRIPAPGTDPPPPDTSAATYEDPYDDPYIQKLLAIMDTLHKDREKVIADTVADAEGHTPKTINRHLKERGISGFEELKRHWQRLS